VKAIVSVSDKTGLAEFTKNFKALGIEIYSTGGTKKALLDAGVEVHGVSDLTGFPEILDGRVKTLHPKVHGGILARRDLPQHMEELKKNKIDPIDMVVINLYPFVQTVAKAGVTLQDALENIDIGGPTMIRASAKNFPSVLVIVDPADYNEVLEKLKAGKVDMEFRKKLAQKAFQHVAMYDTAISQYLREPGAFPEDLTLAMKKKSTLRYGENPHQKGALYVEQYAGKTPRGLVNVNLVSGPELSFNNFLDLEAAWSTCCDFTDPSIVIIKHTNPCGCCSNNDLIKAYTNAVAADPVSAFGGIVACNRKMDMKLAAEIDKTHYDCIIALDYEDEVVKLLGRKKNLRLCKCEPLSAPTQSQRFDLRPVSGGFLVQEEDYYTEAEFKPRVVTKRAPTEQEMKDMLFGWKCIKHIKSNAIAIAKDNNMLGMGTGQPNRVISARLAAERAGAAAKGASLASDAMIPFPDTIQVGADAGCTAVIQTGGSVKDNEVIAYADSRNVAMVFTGIRHFRH
jgi:phosphoribosylaminoimidazolecarboxamide formyltransferase / IMP cyclohydrolase